MTRVSRWAKRERKRGKKRERERERRTMFLPKGTSKPNGLSPRAENISRRRDIFTKVRCEEILDTPRPLSHGCNSVADLNVNVARQPLWEYSSNSTCSHEYGVISYSIQFTARENFRSVRYSSREKRNFLEIFFSETSSPAQSSLISFSPFFFLPFFLLRTLLTPFQRRDTFSRRAPISFHSHFHFPRGTRRLSTL